MLDGGNNGIRHSDSHINLTLFCIAACILDSIFMEFDSGMVWVSGRHQGFLLYVMDKSDSYI